MNRPTTVDDEPQTFVETALKLGGKSDEEAQKTGRLDRADEQVEALYAARFQTAASPIHRAVWDAEFPSELFDAQPAMASPRCAKMIEDSLATARRHKEAGTIYGPDGRISPEVVRDLGRAGYWGIFVPEEYGGYAAPVHVLCQAIQRMIMVEPTLGGWASIHGGVGAVDPLKTFGTPEQKKRLLPRLASGERISGFALTEPNAGSDLTALRTTARLDGNDYVIDGEKLFITNAICGRTIAVVVLIEGRPQVLIVDLPDREDEHFQLVRYDLHALAHSYNNGLRFNGFRVPKDNLIRPGKGDGLMIAYHGLNNGRVALCSMAAGGMRIMFANLLPWSRFRKTYGAAIDTRELVQRRLGRLAGMIAGCDALAEWCAWLLDTGYRGEMECIIAKIFASESQKEAAIEFFMKTHGGRSFLHGHLFGDNVHDYLAPCIYEGEGEMLGMAFFKSLIKEHGKRYFEPIGRTLAASGIRRPNLANPAHLWALRGPMADYSKWWAREKLSGARAARFENSSGPFGAHAQFAADSLQAMRKKISATMRKYQLGLADRQCRIAELSQQVQDLVTILVTARWGQRQADEVVRASADILCQDLTRKWTGRRPSDAYFRAVTRLGEQIADGGFAPIAGIDAEEILMSYA